MNKGMVFDLVVVGAGIVGLAAAHAARQRGLRVAVVERNARCVGASVRNFGLITLTGQRPGAHRQRAERTLAVWRRLAPQVGIEVLHRGLWVLARRPEAQAVLEAYLQTDMAEGCRLLSASEATRAWPSLPPCRAVLHSPHELRVESRDVIPRLAQWLEQAHGVAFFWNTPVLGIELPRVHTSRGLLHAEHAVVCPGHDASTLYPEALAAAGLRQCTLQMLRLRPATPLRWPGAVMSDLSLVRYEGFAGLHQAQALRTVLQAEQASHLAQGVHLIVVQSADGSLVVGDSHVYGDAEAPFARADIEALILDELQRVWPLPGATVCERWTGVYASAAEPVFKARPAHRVVVGLVTGGTGASTGFAFGEELVDWALQA